MLVVRQISRLLTAWPPGRVPHVADFRVSRFKDRYPNSLYAAPDMTACAAFSKESIMQFANATTLHRKSGGSPSFFFSCK